MHTHAPGSKLNKCYITFTHLRVASFDRDDERCVLEGRVSGIDVGSSNLQHSRNTHRHAPQRGVLFHGEKQRGVTSRSLRTHLKDRQLGEDWGKIQDQREEGKESDSVGSCIKGFETSHSIASLRQSLSRVYPKSVQSLPSVNVAVKQWKREQYSLTCVPTASRGVPPKIQNTVH